MSTPHSVSALSEAGSIGPADTVRHLPSDEEWLVAFVEDGRLCACGWPCGLVPLEDCSLIRKATQAERDALLASMAALEGSDPRGRYARRVLSNPPAPLPSSEGAAEQAPMFFASPEQANALHDRPGDNEGGVYLPVRKTAAGKFTMPLYAAPGAATAAGQLDTLNDDLLAILGRPNFTCIRIAQALRLCGVEIKSKAEHEQATVIHFLLTRYLRHGADWATHSDSDLRAMLDQVEAKNKAAMTQPVAAPPETGERDAHA